MSRRNRGFTLLEVLIAVAVLAIALGALLSGFARYADQAAYLRSRTIALWVAHNALAELSLKARTGPPQEGRSDGDEQMAGALWKYRSEIKNTQDPKLRRIELTVFAPNANTQADTPPSAASLSGFVSVP